MDTTVLAVFDTGAETERTVVDLMREAAIARDDITVIAPDNLDARDPLADADRSQIITDLVWVGMLGGALVGALAGWVAGVGMLATAETVRMIGPLLAAVGGAAIGALVGSTSLSLLGGLTALITTDREAHVYGENLQPNATLLGVVTHDTQLSQVESILREHGARRIEERRGAWRRIKRRHM